MNVRKLLDWRALFIYSHRWLGILVGLIFVAWCVSGIVLMYYGVPHLTAGERLTRLPPLDLSSVRVTPADAAALAPGRPFRLRVSMHGRRPAYRINTGQVFGRWTIVFADTGEVMSGLDQDAALAWLRDYLPEQSTLRYDAYLTWPDHFTRLPALQTHMPMHRIALDDGAGTEYYVSERSGEAVMKTTRWTRILGFSGYITHTFFFFRQQRWWSALLNWTSWIGLVMCVTGAVVGVWRFGITPRFRHSRGGKRVPSRSPYAGWMKWHHYAGLIFGLATITWVFSGLVSLAAIPGIQETLYTPSQISAGARSVQGAGATVHLEWLTVDGLQRAAVALSSSFAPKELELLEFGGESYYIAYRPPTADEAARWVSRSALDFIAPALDREHAIVPAVTPDRVFARFDDAATMAAARAAMPGVAVRDAVWLTDYDDYYYNTVSSFDLGLMKAARTLPALRVRFDDPAETWLYVTPSHGQIVKAERSDRANRWGYYGLHAFDFAFLYRHRPLWDIVVVALLVGVGVSSVTTLVPMCRRLARHARRFGRWLSGHTRAHGRQGGEAATGTRKLDHLKSNQLSQVFSPRRARQEDTATSEAKPAGRGMLAGLRRRLASTAR